MRNENVCVLWNLVIGLLEPFVRLMKGPIREVGNPRHSPEPDTIDVHTRVLKVMDLLLTVELTIDGVDSHLPVGSLTAEVVIPSYYDNVLGRNVFQPRSQFVIHPLELKSDSLARVPRIVVSANGIAAISRRDVPGVNQDIAFWNLGQEPVSIARADQSHSAERYQIDPLCDVLSGDVANPLEVSAIGKQFVGYV